MSTNENARREEFDVVTLVQTEEGTGIRLVAVKIYAKGKPKGTGHKMTFKTGLDPALTQPGDGVLVVRDGGTVDVGVIVETDTPPEVKPGITYMWVVGAVDISEIERLASFDESIQRRISIGKAREAARAAMGDIADSSALLPYTPDGSAK